MMSTHRRFDLYTYTIITEREVRKATREMQNSLSTIDTAQGRADMIQRRYAELLAEQKRTDRENQKAKKRADLLQKEKDNQRSELTKANALKEKLEKLSRELTKENKRLKDDLKDVKETAEDKNEDLHRRLEQMVDDVELAVMTREEPQKVFEQLDQDGIFREKFKSFVQQYEMREIYFASVLRTKELEIKYYVAQHEKLRKAQDAELTKSHQLTRQVSTFSQTENDLRNQLNVYVEKFKQVGHAIAQNSSASAYIQKVEDTLNNSNDLFLTFRKEMEEMSKKTKRLEKENSQLTRKQEATNKNIFQMAEERTHSQSEMDRIIKENDKLKMLCRAMQTNGYSRTTNRDDIVGSQQAVIENPDHEQDPEQDHEGEIDAGETDSEYDEYEEDEELEEQYDDDTEEDQSAPAKPKPFGPVPPPDVGVKAGNLHSPGDTTQIQHAHGNSPTAQASQQPQQQLNGRNNPRHVNA